MPPKSGPKLGIVAGGGALPGQLVDVCRQTGRDVFVIALEGHALPEAFASVPHAQVRLGAAGRILSLLQTEAVKDVVLVGSVRRPSLSELKPDKVAAKLLMKIGVRAFGDDGLLSAVADTFEKEGFSVVGVDDLIGDLRAPDGKIGARQPDDRAWSDIWRGSVVAEALGSLDVGQAVIVQEGGVLGVEAAEGTDGLIRRCRDLHRDGAGGVLVKIKKPGQDRRVDLPTIGPETVEAAAACGLSGIAVEAGNALIVERDRVVELADRSGLFVVGIDLAKRPG